MNEQPTDIIEAPEVDNAALELSLLRERAKAMGISIPGNIGVTSLKKKISDQLEGVKPEPAPIVKNVKVPKTEKQLEQEVRVSVTQKALKLVRCRIYNLNPSKRDLQGEIITVGNKYVGTVRKFIPFGEMTDGGYHIPNIVFTELSNRKFQQVATKRVNGNISISTRLVPEYNIEVLPNLTASELAELALNQEAAKRVNVE